MRDDIVGYKMHCGVFLFALDFVWLGLFVQSACCLDLILVSCSFVPPSIFLMRDSSYFNMPVCMVSM